jgi:hypothetical protein
MNLCRVFCFLAMCAAPLAAVPFTLNFTWTPVAGLGANSADFFDFQFVDPSGELKLTQLSVTLGNNLIYDLTNSGPGYVTWGAYALNDGGAGATQTSAALGEGTGGNRTIAWNLTSFIGGVTLSYGADVDESGTCASGIIGAICRANVDSVAPGGFISRGAIDVAFTVEFINGFPGSSFNFPASGQSWSNNILNASTSYTGEVFTPEPASWVLGLGGLSLCALLRRKIL